MSARAARFGMRRERTGWLLPLGIALGLHLVFLLAGYLSTHDTLLDLIARGEVEAAGPADPQPAVEQEVELVDQPPPPEAHPDFVVPQEEQPPDDAPPMPEELAEAEPSPAPAPAPVPPPPAPAPPVSVPAPAPPAPAVAAAAAEAQAPLAASSPVPAEERFTPSEVVVGNRGFPKPPYPYEAKLRHAQGTVLVSLSVVDGVIVEAAVEKSSGYAVLDRTAVSWIRKKWRFPAEVTRNLSQPVAFELSEGA